MSKVNTTKTSSKANLAKNKNKTLSGKNKLISLKKEIKFPNFLTDNQTEIEAMGQKCKESIQKFRQQKWTDYARTAGQYVKHNFGVGLEPAVKCFGCHRLLPPTLITGDHIVPKSNQKALREMIAYKLDGFNKEIYEKVVDIQVTPLRSEPIKEFIEAIKKYDITLEEDNRNIQPLCWYCNTKKGDRNNVKLFPDSVLLPRRPHEAPF